MSATPMPSAPPEMQVPTEADGQGVDTPAGTGVSRDPVSRHSTDPVLSAYIREVSRVPLLSRDEEILLFTTLYEARETAFRLMNALEDMLTPAQSKLLKASTLRYEEMHQTWQAIADRARERLATRERAELKRAFSTWQSARERIMTANLRLVIFTVKRFRNDSCLFMDLIQEGNIGLMRAIDRYDLDRSLKFSTYALWWIWQAVNRAHAKNVYTVRIPVYKVQEVGRYNRKRRALAADLERMPTDEEVAREVGISTKEVQQVAELQANSISLDDASDEEAGGLVEFLTCQDDSPEEEVMHQDMESVVRGALEVLPPREAQVLRWRYGVDSDVHTLQEIGAKLQVSRERVRQLEQQAISRLRRADVAVGLTEYAVDQ
ncbi:RNA polymerase sigma factor RpoD/SigA [Candidatus Poribacteria bacterium]|jgi:RNA polymerase primary sigma factor|nr:RNA polymerase sigma factor RpoD/SigA [Candidatus Poribacteria bacterium]MBT5533395.1 RNA polymerase sigma factor RpoD/SigA [Candidatus Poribacteria bacterium]MBT5714447.1 RNA polymerase sigma factor RpoD/SigA [Candidatus Poribacteria bacterium]MBT7805578.1 RNA polymerase sigma factor RpoD/SigA [Candidatus Poribacteria bacterium]